MAAAKATHLRLTPAAQQDLRDIWDYTVDTWSMVQADRYLDIRNANRIIVMDQARLLSLAHMIRSWQHKGCTES